MFICLGSILPREYLQFSLCIHCESERTFQLIFYTYKALNDFEDKSLATQPLPKVVNEKTEVLRGEQRVVNTVLQFTSKASSTIDACVDYTRPSLTVEVEQLKNAFLSAKRRGVKLRYVTEITRDNVAYCKELIKMTNELRHIDGVKGNFYLSETEYIAPASFHEKGKPASWIIYSNVKELVEHQRLFVFSSFWSRSIPAEVKIREIEEGIIHYETKILETKDEIFSHIKSVLDKATERSVVSSIGGLQLVYNNFFEQYKKIIDKQRRSERKEGRGIRWVTSIDRNGIDLIKLFLKAGIKIRHVKNLAPMNFAVDERYFYATIDEMDSGILMPKLLISNEPAYITHYNTVFEELWKNGVDAKQRIKDIKAGVDLAEVEVIPSSVRAQEVYLQMLEGVSEEILWIFPTAQAFIRQERIGAIRLATEAAKEKSVRVKVLIPKNDLIEQKIQKLKQSCGSQKDSTIDVRYIAQMSETKATILVIDRKASLVMEVKDDSRSSFIEAIGLSTYSNSKAGVYSYAAIFENLWRQAELYDQLKKAHEQLKIHDKMQEEFINIAAHELRTPIQPILGLIEIISNKLQDRKEEAELLNIISRNAKRLRQLTENILDITKIESNSLQLNKERFNLREIISNAISDCKNQLKEYGRVKIELRSDPYIFVLADKARISQVISNLLDNAVKFTKEQKLQENTSILVRLEVHKNTDNNNKEVHFSMKDTGIGIAPEIMPRLFTKFTTKSEKGTGLGLFISKSIIEAHGGKIWAENNTDGKGATFAFSLPTLQ
jgi:signal transduction histidine kinase